MPTRPIYRISPDSGPHTAASLRAAVRLSRDFFARDARVVARELVGKLLIRREGRKLLAGRVVEDEAYLGAIDPAAHTYNGRTARNAVMFGPPGHAYVYFIYGNSYCTNVSCMPEGEAEGVLLRALEPVLGVQAMADARGLSTNRGVAHFATSADLQRTGQDVGSARHHPRP